MEEKTYKYTDAYGNDYDLFLEKETYMDGNLAIMAYSLDEDGFDELYCDVTKNLGEPLPEDCAYVDTNNVHGILEWIVENGIGEDTGIRSKSGFCEYPLVRFKI